MDTPQNIKTMVREKYSEIADQDPALNAASCCGVDGCATLDYSIFSEDYSQVEGYLATADLKLGCGMPVEHAGIRRGHTVLDLGSGAGNDVFVARVMTGEAGEVIGLDMTERMIEKARENARNLGLTNVKFRLGEIEDIPMANDRVDVVISNCVLNLVPDKQKAFDEIERVLRPGGHFAISDVVVKGELPDALRNAAEMYAGCVAGALTKSDYLGIIHEAGFTQVSVVTEKEIDVPDETLLNYMAAEDVTAFRNSTNGIFSITVTAVKTADVPQAAEACAPGSGCC